MFKIAKNPQFTHTVKVVIPVDDDGNGGGGHEEQTMRVRFKVRTVDDLNQHDRSTSEGTETFLRSIVVRFEDVVDETGTAIPSDEALTDRLLAFPFVRMAVVQAYFDAVNKARLGN